MTGDSDPRDELRAELLATIDGLSEEQAGTLLAWAQVILRKRRSPGHAGGIVPLDHILGITRDVRAPDKTRMRLEVDPVWFNPNGRLHGGVIYTMVDSSMGATVTSALDEGQSCATIEISVSYLSSVREGTLTVETEIIKRGRNLVFTESKVRDAGGKLIATASGSMFILRPDAAT